ncbi:MAG: 50S ribosomal protein L15 [Candidatus Melainabacteria bacterium]|nr:50S ribosomal protein L15 [Candidatus Melainabacteria bacterium]
MTLSTLAPAPGSTRKRLRVGRGRASGAGKTCNRGHNGEGQRSGRSRKRGFEGGQMPGYRRLPKLRTFPNPNRRTWLELNVGDLDSLLVNGATAITYDLLREMGLLKNKFDGVRILGNGSLKQKLSIEAHYATPAAKEKIEAAGGQIVLAV